MKKFITLIALLAAVGSYAAISITNNLAPSFNVYTFTNNNGLISLYTASSNSVASGATLSFANSPVGSGILLDNSSNNMDILIYYTGMSNTNGNSTSNLLSQGFFYLGNIYYSSAAPSLIGTYTNAYSTNAP